MPELDHQQLAQAVLDCSIGKGTDAQQVAIKDITVREQFLIYEAHHIGFQRALEKAMTFFKGEIT